MVELKEKSTCLDNPLIMSYGKFKAFKFLKDKVDQRLAS